MSVKRDNLRHTTVLPGTGSPVAELDEVLRSSFDDCGLMEPTIIFSATTGRSMMIITMLALLPIKNGVMEGRPSEGWFRPICSACRVQEGSNPIAARP